MGSSPSFVLVGYRPSSDILTVKRVELSVQAMEKRIPQNPKYKNTQSKIDTGATVNKVRLICKWTV